jgi:RecA-family ATPase
MQRDSLDDLDDDPGFSRPANHNRMAHVAPSSPEGESRRTSVFFPASDLEGKPVPPRRFHVDGLIPAKTITILSGDGGTGKSLTALQLAASTALGRAWFGRQVTQGRVLFISAEDDTDELHRRIADIARAEGFALADLDGMILRSLAGEDALLAVQAKASGALTATDLFREVEAQVYEHAPALVILDTLADLFPGNENDRAQARQFIGLLRGLAIRHGCAVLLLSHPSLSGLNSGSGTSGSTAWNNSVRSRLYLERVVVDGYEPDHDARVLTTKKANYSKTGGEIRIKWMGGVFIADEPETAGEAMNATIKAERVFLKILRTMTEQGRRVNHAGGGNYAPKVFAAHPESEGITKRAFGQAMEILLRDGKIRIAQEGPPSRRVTYIEEGVQ